MIAAHLLIHTASVFTPAGLDMDRNPTYGAGVAVKCRIVPKDGRAMGNTGAEPADAYVMLANTALAVGQKVIWEGKSLSIRKAWPCYALNPEHPDHWKAELV